MSATTAVEADGQAQASLVMMSLARLARLAQERRGLQRSGGPAPQLIRLKAASTDAGLAPLVFVHPAGGSIIAYKELSQHLGGDRSVYGIQSQPDEAQNSLCHDSLADLAENYVRQLEAAGLATRVVLSGYSLGGVVAFEMARLLTARGHSVEAVVVIDTPVRLNPLPASVKAITAGQLLMFGKVLAAGRSGALDLTPSHFEGLSAERQVERLIERLREMNLLGDCSDDVYRAVYRMVRHNERLQRSHVPEGRWDGSMTLIRAAAESPELRQETGALYDDPAFGWGPHCTTPVECIRVPGSHFSLMYPPFIASLGQALDKCLQAKSGADMAALFAAQVRTRPDGVALRASDRVFSYRQLHAHAVAMAARLAAAGVGRSDLVALCGERSPGYVIAMLAVVRLGAAYLPLDPSQPRERTELMLADAAPRLLLLDPLHVDAPTGAASALPRLAYDARPEADRFDVAADDFDTEPAVVAPTQLAYVMYTSGTTGRPKGVCVTRAGVVRLVDRVDYVRLGPSSCLLQHSNLCFDASTFEIWGSLLTGGTCVLMPHARPSLQQLEQVLVDNAVTTLFMTSALFRELAERRPQALRGVREVLVGGEILAPAAARQALAVNPELSFIHVYGPTECTTFALSRRFGSGDPIGDALPLGQPLPQTTIQVLDDAGKPVADGIEGELCVGGSGLARGYLRRDDLTRDAFTMGRDADGGSTRLYRTGDRVLRDADGELYFKGRRDAQVKVRGFRVELGEVEGAAKSAPGVLDAAVKAVPAETGENMLVAYAVPRPEAVAPEPNRDAALLTERVAHWEQVYSRLLYKSLGSADQAGQDPTLNSTGWKSSFDGRPFADDVMEEQFATGAARIMALEPRHVLEIGCGTGMLLFRIAPRCLSYTATDFSATVIDYVRARAAERGLRNLRLHHAAADELPPAPEGGFDTVILNSVTEHFPSLRYLNELLRAVAPLVKPGGHIYVGDNRNATLLPLFHAAVQLYRSEGSESLASLALRTAQAQVEETQLTIAPAYFTQLAGFGLRCVDLQCKRGRHRNEMTQYRFDATLRVGDAGDARATAPVVQRRWRDGVDSPAVLCDELRAGLAAPLLLRGLPNARLSGATLLLDAAAGGSPLQSAGAVRRALDQCAKGEDPEDWWALGRALGCKVGVMPSGSPDGRFDVLLNPGDALLPALAEPAPLSSLANDPLLSLRTAALARDLKTALNELLPSHAVPHFIVVLPHLPLTPNGKVDAAALPRPTRLQRTGTASPATAGRAGEAMEQRVAAVWESVLGIAGIAADDDFFAIGGDSLRAVRVAAMLSAELACDISPALLFEHRQLAALARHLGTVSGSIGPGSVAPGSAQAISSATPTAAARGRQRRAALNRASSQIPASSALGGDAVV